MIIDSTQVIDVAKFANGMDGYNFNNQLIAISISPFTKENIRNLNSNNNYGVTNMIAFMLVLSGSINITIDYRTYTFKKNSWVEISPSSIVKMNNYGNDFMANLLLVSESFIVDTLLDKKPIPVSHFMDMKETPSIELSDIDVAAIKISMDRIFYYLRLENHNYRQDMLHNTFYNLILEVGNIFTNIDKNRTQPQIVSRKENIIIQFMYLVGQYAKKEHLPSFYADKLCISTQYLTLILKEATGKTANHWIAKKIITEAKILLRTPGTTLQQISDTLSFADQSSFGKFFKKHTGISPKKYREDYSIPR